MSPASSAVSDMVIAFWASAKKRLRDILFETGLVQGGPRIHPAYPITIAALWVT